MSWTNDRSTERHMHAVVSKINMRAVLQLITCFRQGQMMWLLSIDRGRFVTNRKLAALITGIHAWKFKRRQRTDDQDIELSRIGKSDFQFISHFSTRHCQQKNHGSRSFNGSFVTLVLQANLADKWKLKKKHGHNVSWINHGE